MNAVDEDLVQVLTTAQERGHIGPGPVRRHIDHARRLAGLVHSAVELADLGSGGGLPGLVIARLCPTVRLVLIESSAKRAAWLVEAAARLGLDQRVEVEARRAEEVGADPARRGAFDLVSARSFGRPAVTAECAAPLLRLGGRLLVSEPPRSDGERWTGLAGTGLGLALVEVHGFPDAHIAELHQQVATEARFPRRTGVPGKRPLF